MSDFGRIDGRDLDRYITGNYGEDSVPPEPIEFKEWLKDYGNVLTLGAWLVEECFLATADHVQSYYEKPWKYETEWKQMQSGVKE